MKSGPSTNGSSRNGSGSSRVPWKMPNGPSPRRMAASPMVAMTTAITGRPMSLRSITRSSANPNRTMPAIANATDGHSGTPSTVRAPTARKPAIMTNSPWAKLTASVAL